CPPSTCQRRDAGRCWPATEKRPRLAACLSPAGPEFHRATRLALSASVRCTAASTGNPCACARHVTSTSYRCYRKTQQHDAPFQNPAADPEEIEVTDPTHPLYGRRFPVLSISHPPQRLGHVVVAYRGFMRLRLPVQATRLSADNARRLRTPF